MTVFAQLSGHKKLLSGVDSFYMAPDSTEIPISTDNWEPEGRTDFYSGGMPSVLHASRDVLQSMSAFHFSAVHFQARGLGSYATDCLINGMDMRDPETGKIPWSAWSALMDVFRKNISVSGPISSTEGLGGVSGLQSFDVRSLAQRDRIQIVSVVSNRQYRQKWSIQLHSLLKKGWRFSAHWVYRYSEKGAAAGTYAKENAWYLAADKALQDGHTFSLLFFGSAGQRAKQSPVLPELKELSGDVYNAYWGYQANRIRNANVISGLQPVLLLQDEHRLGPQSVLTFTIGSILSDQEQTALNWYDAPDPRPDYYRNLPSFQKDSALRQQTAVAYRQDINLRQINWERLYAINRQAAGWSASFGIPGQLRAHYILEARHRRTLHTNMAVRFHTVTAKGLTIAAGLSANWYRSRYFKTLDDLLGGDYYLDWNSFAERARPGNRDVLQNDLSYPDRLVKYGATFGYHYRITGRKEDMWVQVDRPGRTVDISCGVSFTRSQFEREGLMRNGLFPYSSYGRSITFRFATYVFKTGLVYKFNGKEYLYLQARTESVPPLPDAVFLSPAISNQVQDIVHTGRLNAMELGFYRNAPGFGWRSSFYYTTLAGGMDVLSFYHDGYGNLVHYAMRDIAERHIGLETGMRLDLSEHWQWQIATAIGRYVYADRIPVTVSADTDAGLWEKTKVYARNYRIGGTPQEAYGTEIHYQSGSGWYGSISASLFRQQWLQFNPFRRTEAALQGVSNDAAIRERILEQTLLPDQFLLDFSGGSSFNLGSPSGKQHTSGKILSLFVSVRNLLNKRDLITGGFEQLRFDINEKNPEKFPPKFFFGQGINYSVHLRLRLF